MYINIRQGLINKIQIVDVIFFIWTQQIELESLNIIGKAKFKYLS